MRSSTAPALEAFLRRHPAIHHAETSNLSETVTVGYDESRISEAVMSTLNRFLLVLVRAMCDSARRQHRAASSSTTADLTLPNNADRRP